jgi:membrane protease YdiL (CAAX protease family)
MFLSMLFSTEVEMRPWIPYLGLAIFPFALLGQVNPTRFSWGYYHRSDPMPPDVQEKAERFDRHTWPLRDGLIVALIMILMRYERIPAWRLGLHFAHWKANATIGVISGFLLIGFREYILKLPRVEEGFDDYGLSKGSVSLWCLAFLIGAFSEEFWIAFCLVTMRGTHHSVASAIVVTAAVFGAVHYPYRLGALAVACIGALSGSLFLWRSSLLPSYLFHFIGNIGTLYWVRRNARISARI